MSDPLTFTVPEELAGIRLDRCLSDLHPEWTRSRTRKLIDGGHVLLNDDPAKASAKVRCGDRIVVDEPPARSLDAEAEDIPLDIVFEDDDVLVVNKPAGLVIHPAAGNPSGTLVNALLHHCRDLSGIGGVLRPGIVHRLDKDTSINNLVAMLHVQPYAAIMDGDDFLGLITRSDVLNYLRRLHQGVGHGPV